MSKGTKKLLPWAAIVALLTGLALLPGPKAGAAVPVPLVTVTPQQATITSSVAQNSAGTGLVLTWTLTNTSDVTEGFYLYGCAIGDQTACSPSFGNGDNQLTLAAGASSSFTFDEACGTTTATVDVAVPYADPPGDLPGAPTIDVACVPPTTTTTVPVVTTPPPAPPAPSGLPPVSVPVVTPAPTMAPLAFTGAPILPEVGVALALIALGLLLVRRSVRHA